MQNISSNIIMGMINIFKRYIWLMLRIGVSLFILFLIFRAFSVVKLKEVILSLNLWWIILAMIIALLRNAVSTLRWKIILDYQGIKTSFFDIYRAYLEAYSFNQFMPTSIGGDLRRGWSVKKQGKSMVKIFSGILYERLLGYAGLAMVGVIGLLGMTYNKVKIFPPGLILLFLFVFVFILIVSFLLPKWFEKLNIKYIRVQRGLSHMSELRDFNLVMRVSLYSIIFHLLIIYSVWCMSMSANLQVPLIFYMGLLPIVTMISELPISLNGWGIKEGVFYLYLGRFGVHPEQAAIISLLFNLPVLFLAFTGVMSLWHDRERING